MTPQSQRFRSPEMAELMDKVQQLLEAHVVAMVLIHPTGNISVTCPPARRAEVMAILHRYLEQEEA